MFLRPFVVTLALASAACATAPATVASPPAPTRAPGPPPPSLDGAWALALLRDAPADQRLAATLKLNGSRAEGQSACRAWSAEAPNFGMDLRFGAISAERRTCEPGADSLEQRYAAALAATRTATIRDGYLVLRDADGRDRLYFQRTS
jgi:heat shock protein HslJ